MAIQQINQVAKVIPGKKAKGGGAGLGSMIGGTIGAITGGVIGFGGGGGPLGAAKGASVGFGAGSSAGSALGGAIAPASGGTADQVTQAPPVPLSASSEAMRAQTLLAGLQASQQDPILAEYSEPISQAYINSMINLKKMG